VVSLTLELPEKDSGDSEASAEPVFEVKGDPLSEPTPVKVSVLVV